MSEGCSICKNIINKKSDKFNIKIACTECSNIPVLTFIESIIGGSFISNVYDICKNCYILINELDTMQKAYEAIRRKLTNYLGHNTISRKSMFYHTNWFPDNILEFDVHAKYKTAANKLRDTEDFHLNSSVNGKQYECHVCFKRFASKNGVSLHLKKVHGQKLQTKDDVTTNYKTNLNTKTEGKGDEAIKHQNEFLSSETEELVDVSHKLITECIDVKHINTYNNEITRNFINTAENDNIFADVISIKSDVENSSSSLNMKQDDINVRKTKKKKFVEVLKPYTCLTCEKAFKTQSELKSHMSAHTDVRCFICEICGQGYKNKSALDIHVGMHNGINPFTCIYCNKSFTQKGALRRHMPIHTGEAPYQCDLCGKRFVHHTSFHIHQLTHSGQKQYKCSVCGLALLSGSHLKRHMRVHTGERNYVCPTCGKRFAERYNLASHQKLHANPGSTKSGRKTFRCQICRISYDLKIKLNEHLTSEHPEVVISVPSDVKPEEIAVWPNNSKSDFSQPYQL